MVVGTGKNCIDRATMFTTLSSTCPLTRPRTHGNVFLRFCIVSSNELVVLDSLENSKQYKNAGKPFRVYGVQDYVHTVSFSLGFYIVLRPQGIRKQMKTLRKRHRVHIAQVRPKVQTCDSTKDFAHLIRFGS